MLVTQKLIFAVKEFSKVKSVTNPTLTQYDIIDVEDEQLSSPRLLRPVPGLIKASVILNIIYDYGDVKASVTTV